MNISDHLTKPRAINLWVAQTLRELQEYRGSFILVPAVIAGVLCALYLLALLLSWLGSEYLVDMLLQEASLKGQAITYFDEGLVAGYRAIYQEVGATVVQGALWVTGWLFGSVVYLLVVVYLLGCLYNDRRDGSILFWKSLPVSETRNLLTKLLVALLVAPGIAMLAVLAAQLVFMLVISLHFAGSGAVSLWEIWRGANLLGNFLGVWIMLVSFGLWLLPVYSWLLVASAWAKKAPFLSAVTPLIVAVILERLLLGSSHFARMLAQRLRGPDLDSLPGLLLTPELWIGFLISALLVAVAVWLRNNRYQL